MKIKFILLDFILFLSLSAPKLVAQPLTIKELKIEGNTILAEEIESLANSYLHQAIEERKLRKLTDQITQLYVRQGYYTSGAFLTEQEISSGVIKIQVVEGELEHIEIEGLQRLKPNYINSRLKRASRVPFNIHTLEEALQSLQADPFIEKVQARLVEGTTAYTSVLLLDIEETSVLNSTIVVNNSSSPNIGEIRGVVTLTSQNLLGLRDIALVQYDLTEGLSTYNLNYTVPLNLQGTTFSVNYRDGDNEIIQEPFDDLDIRAQADTLSFKLIQPIVRSATTEFLIGLSFDISESKTFIFDDRPYSFTDGPQDGRSKLTIIRLSSDLLKRSEQNVLSIRSRFSLGVDLFGATVNENDPDTRFFSWLGQVQWARALNPERDIILITRLSAQLASDSLLPFEQFNLGGAGTVRGYRHNRLLADNGFASTVELAFTIVNEPESWGIFKLVPFVDVGAVWNNEGGNFKSLASVGLGFDWRPRDWISLKLDYGIPLSDVKDLGNSLGDNGFSFSLKLLPLRYLR